jgi:predicted anti-sigma-YlaC factor YlaD
MHARPGKHPDEQTLEVYLLGSLPSRKAKRIEEHLLACPECVDTSGKLADYIRSMRAALGNGKARLTIARKAQPG